MLKRIAQGLALLLFVIALLLYFVLRPIPARPADGDLRLAESAGKKIQYHVSGNGPAIVLLPSFARSASDFNELALALNTQGYQTIAVQPGGIEGSDWLGMSATLNHYADGIAEVLRAENIDQPVVVAGHAFGNRVARSFAAQYPKHTFAVILLAAGGEEATPDVVSTAIQTILFGFEQQARADAVRLAFFADDSELPDYWVNGWFPLAGLSQGAATASSDFSHWGGAGSSPMLVLQSLEDKAAPADVAGRVLKQRYPKRVKYAEVANAGHAFLPEQHQWLEQNIVNYLTQIAYRKIQ